MATDTAQSCGRFQILPEALGPEQNGDPQLGDILLF